MALPQLSFPTPHGIERLGACLTVPRHRHWQGYITVVLAGGYQEAGLDGRRLLTAGDVIVHGCHDAHLDHVGPTGAELLNLPLPSDARLPMAFRIEDPDSVVRIAERDATDAVRSLVALGEVAPVADWPDELAAALALSPNRRLDQWARDAGLAAETLSRGFRTAYGVTPARFRAEVRARRAMGLIVGSELGLAAIAADCGFADQAHLTRTIVELTGRAPGYWRKSNPFKKSPARTE